MKLELNPQEALWLSVALRRYARTTNFYFESDRKALARLVNRFERARRADERKRDAA